MAGRFGNTTTSTVPTAGGRFNDNGTPRVSAPKVKATKSIAPVVKTNVVTPAHVKQTLNKTIDTSNLDTSVMGNYLPALKDTTTEWGKGVIKGVGQTGSFLS